MVNDHIFEVRRLALYMNFLSPVFVPLPCGQFMFGERERKRGESVQVELAHALHEKEFVVVVKCKSEQIREKKKEQFSNSSS